MNNTAYRITPIPTIKNFNYMFNKKHNQIIKYLNTSRKVVLIMFLIIIFLSITNIITLVINYNLNNDIENLKIYISEML